MKASYHHCPRKTCLELFLTQSFNGKHKFVKQLKGYKIPPYTKSAQTLLQMMNTSTGHFVFLFGTVLPLRNLEHTHT